MRVQIPDRVADDSISEGLAVTRPIAAGERKERSTDVATRCNMVQPADPT